MHESSHTSASPPTATPTSSSSSTPSGNTSESPFPVMSSIAPPPASSPPPLFSQSNVRKHEYWQFAKLIAPAHALPESKKAWTTDDAVGIWCLRCVKALPYQKGSSQSIRYHMETKHALELAAFRDKVARIKESSSSGRGSPTVTSSPSAGFSNGRGHKRKEIPSVAVTVGHSDGDSAVPMRLNEVTPPLTMDVVYIPVAPSAPPASAVAPAAVAPPVAVPVLAAPVRTTQSNSSGGDLTSWHRNVQRRSGFWGNAYWYDLQLCRRMPLAQPMLDELIMALPPCDSKRVIDLCAGSGRASAALLVAYPTAMVTLVDSSSERLGIAQKRLMDAGAIGNVQFVTKAIALASDGSGSETITNSMPVDVVVGCLALHVLAEKPKHYEAEAGTSGNSQQVVYSVEATYEQIFRLIFNSLAPGGHLVFADHVGQLGLFKQLQLMAQVGFVDVDCAWRQEDSFVAGGRRPVL